MKMGTTNSCISYSQKQTSTVCKHSTQTCYNINLYNST